MEQDKTEQGGPTLPPGPQRHMKRTAICDPGRPKADQTHEGQTEFLPDEQRCGKKDGLQISRRPNFGQAR